MDLITDGDYLVANLFSYVISFSVLYIWDQSIFKARPITKRRKLEQLINFIIVRIIGFPLDSLVLSILINDFNIGNMKAKILGSLIMFMYNYITNKLFVFRKNKLI